MRSDVFQIRVDGGVTLREDFKDALSFASVKVRKRYILSGELGECFAFIYLPIAGKRWIAWLNEKLEIKYRLLSSVREDR